MSGERVFNTGKVSIGLAYERKPLVSMDRDALRLQSALLGERKGLDADGIVVVTCVAGLVAVVLMAVAGWI
jgi:hypothetical protein